MGLFDMVFLDCPACGKSLEFQTKGANIPYMNRFDADAVPLAVAAYLFTDDDEQTCEHTVECDCGASLQLLSDPPFPATVRLSLVVREADSDG